MPRCSWASVYRFTVPGFFPLDAVSFSKHVPTFKAQGSCLGACYHMPIIASRKEWKQGSILLITLSRSCTQHFFHLTKLNLVIWSHLATKKTWFSIFSLGNNSMSNWKSGFSFRIRSLAQSQVNKRCKLTHWTKIPPFNSCQEEYCFKMLWLLFGLWTNTFPLTAPHYYSEKPWCYQGISWNLLGFPFFLLKIIKSSLTPINCWLLQREKPRMPSTSPGLHTR